MTLKVLVSERMAPAIRSLESDYPHIAFSVVPMAGPMKPEYLQADILWMSALSDEIFDEILAHNEDLKWIQLTAAGFDWILRDALTQRIEAGLRVTRSANSFNVPIAEFVLAGMFSYAKKFPDLMDSQRERLWTRPEADEIVGSTVTVLGTGAIGREVAWRAKALGSRVIGVSRSGAPTKEFDQVVRQDALKSVLSETDFLVIAVPLTGETRHMIGQAELALLPRNCVLINIGRGAVVDNESLKHALVQRTIAGAIVDVFEQEPLPADSELWDVPNLMVTPHASFRGSGNLERLEQDFRNNLDEFLAGKALAGEMKAPELGY